MKFAQLILQENILNTAISLVNSAEKEIFVTMNVDEEIMTPLSLKYQKAIINATDRGVHIVRYGYGSMKNFREIKKLYQAQNVTFEFAGDLTKYQRMLTVDKKRGIFKLNSNVFYSQFPLLIESLVQYAHIHYNKETL